MSKQSSFDIFKGRNNSNIQITVKKSQKELKKEKNLNKSPLPIKSKNNQNINSHSNSNFDREYQKYNIEFMKQINSNDFANLIELNLFGDELRKNPITSKFDGRQILRLCHQ